jgi:hypothetical protein
MELHKLNNFTKGWFIGNFEPTLYNTDFEVGIKEYKSGDKEQRHFHKEADEFTAIISGKVLMNGIEYAKGDIIKVVKFEDTDFECIEDCITVVVKTKSIKGDKYLI